MMPMDPHARPVALFQCAFLCAASMAMTALLAGRGFAADMTSGVTGMHKRATCQLEKIGLAAVGYRIGVMTASLNVLPVKGSFT